MRLILIMIGLAVMLGAGTEAFAGKKHHSHRNRHSGHPAATEAPVKKKVVVPRPKAILVQLKCEGNRIAFFKKNGNARLLDQVYKDAAAIRQTTINDFRDHFSWCPVYFFPDSSFSSIIEHHLQGHLFHADGSAAGGGEIEDLDTNYMIANYSTPYDRQQVNITRAIFTTDVPTGDGLVAYDHRYRQLQAPFPFFTGPRMNIFKRLANGQYNSYNYDSRIFEMMYFAVAAHFQSSLNWYYQKFGTALPQKGKPAP